MIDKFPYQQKLLATIVKMETAIARATATFQYERDPENPKILYVPFDNSEFTWMPDRMQITLFDDEPVYMQKETKVEEPLLESEEIWQIVKNYYYEIGKPIPKKVREDCVAEIAREKDLRANPPPPLEMQVEYSPPPSMDERPDYGTPEFWKWYSKHKAFFQAKKKAAADAKAAKEAEKEAKEKEKLAKQREIQAAKAKKLAEKEAKLKEKEDKAAEKLAKQMAKMSIKEGK